MNTLKPIDHNLLKLNQLAVIGLNLTAFIFNLPWLAALTGLLMLVGAALSKPLLALGLKPVFALKPEIVPDNPEPHRFAQGLGGLFLVAGAVSLFAGLTPLGWAFTWLVTALAALNAFGGFCAGCFMYYWLTRLGAPGFVKTPPAGSRAGFRPKAG